MQISTGKFFTMVELILSYKEVNKSLMVSLIYVFYGEAETRNCVGQGCEWITAVYHLKSWTNIFLCCKNNLFSLYHYAPLLF